MKVCAACGSFKVKSFWSYLSHLGKCSKGASILEVDMDYLDANFDSLGSSGMRGLRREVLLKKADYSCSQCGFSKTRADGSSILEIDHIDGNPENNDRDNLRVLCPNCHALTDTFRNVGNRGNKKTSPRLRAGNKEHQPSSHKELKARYNAAFIEKVKDLDDSGEIDFSSFGWVQKLSEHFNESPQVTGRRLRRLMPLFYEEKCFRKSHTKYKSSLADKV